MKILLQASSFFSFFYQLKSYPKDSLASNVRPGLFLPLSLLFGWLKRSLVAR